MKPSTFITKIGFFLIFLSCIKSSSAQPWEQAVSTNDIASAERIAGDFLKHAEKIGSPDTLGLAWYRMAWVQVMKNDYSSQLRAYRKAREYFSESQNHQFLLSINLNRGIVYRELGKPKLAIAELLKADSISRLGNSKTYKLFEYLAHTSLELNDLPSARAWLDSLGPLSVTNSEKALYYQIQGRYYMLLGHHDYAQESFKFSLDYCEHDTLQKTTAAWNYQNLATIAQKLGNIEVESLYITAIALAEGKFAKPYLDYGWWLDKQDRQKEALEIYHLLFEEAQFSLEQRENREDLLQAIEFAEQISNDLHRVNDFIAYAQLRKEVIEHGMIGRDIANKEREWAEHQSDEIARVSQEKLKTERTSKLRGIIILVLTCVLLSIFAALVIKSLRSLKARQRQALALLDNNS